MVGITSYGAYLPRLRLKRAAAFQAMGWLAPAIGMVAQGERSLCNWDEDTITMAVGAARDCLKGTAKPPLDGLYLASTTLPFADRQNAGIVAAALNLGPQVFTADFGGSQKAGASALLSALESVMSGEKATILVAASDRRQTKAGTFYEMWFGDGAAAFTVGTDKVIAAYRGSYSISEDFIDHYRGSDHRYDYTWEERWARDAGYRRLIPEAVNGLLHRLDLTIDQIDKLVYPCFFKRDHRKIAEQLGADPEALVDNLHEICGETGTAHPLVMMVSALESAAPGERILMAGFGQGCSALLFQATEAKAEWSGPGGFRHTAARKTVLDNYTKWLQLRDLVKTDMGIRAETPTQTATTVLWRKNEMILGLVGGKCEQCATAQFPKTNVCVNPSCGGVDTQVDYGFADVPARVKTYTADMLSVSVDPPAIYGMVQFEGGGRLMADFTDCTLADLSVGQPVEMVFRRKHLDKQRGFSNYFWKATPLGEDTASDTAISFDGRVAVVTGAGGGLGRTYALELARRGAKVVVNDFGGARDGSGSGSQTPAETVVAQIKGFGGEAVVNTDNVASVDGGAAVVQSALDAFGTLDILINNAGILRDKTFVNMTPENWRAVVDVHLGGAYHVTRPAMAVMKQKGYGRIVLTTSGAGLFGNFGQSNYAAAKMGLIGLMNALKLEGAKYDIKVNTVAPLAASRLTEDVMPPELFAQSRPEYVSPLVMVLCSEQCPESGAIYNAGLGHFSRSAVLTAPWIRLGDATQVPSPEAIRDHWRAVDSLENAAQTTDAVRMLTDLLAMDKDPD